MQTQSIPEPSEDLSRSIHRTKRALVLTRILPNQKLNLLYRKAQECKESGKAASVMALLQMFFSLLNKNQQTQRHLGKQF